MTWSGSSQSPRKGYFYIIALEPPQCQHPASRACIPSYTATGAGGHDDHPASSCPRCSTFWGQSADFPPCQPVTSSSGLSQGTLLGHSNITGACGGCELQPVCVSAGGSTHKEVVIGQGHTASECGSQTQRTQGLSPSRGSHSLLGSNSR